MATRKKKDDTTTILLFSIGALVLYSMTQKKAAPAPVVPITTTNNPIVTEPALPVGPVAPIVDQPVNENFIDAYKPAGYLPMFVEPELQFPKPSVFPTKYPEELVYIPHGGYGGFNPILEKYQDLI